MAESDPKLLIKNFFLQRNRPFGASDVILSMQKQIPSKSLIQKSIDALGSRLVFIFI